MKFNVNVNKILENKSVPEEEKPPYKKEKKDSKMILESYGFGDGEITDYMNFQNDTFELFYGDEDITVENFIDFVSGCCKYEHYDNVIEASGAGHVTARKADYKLRKVNDKVNGKKNTLSKNLRHIDDKASEVANRKLDDIINMGREIKREKLIEGRPRIKIGKFIRDGILAIAGATGTAALFGPATAAVIVGIGMLCRADLLKKTEKREKERILLDLETDLRITREKIEDAKAENDRKKKYQLMRIEATLQKEITRIKYGLRYY